jgi:predicted RNase H-like nuclease
LQTGGEYRGWAVFWHDLSGRYGFADYPDITKLMTEHKNAGCLFIDIPIGLPENRQQNVARPDQKLRSRLPGKASSVFNTPCRQAVYARDKQTAKACNLQVLQKILSEQSLGFTPKIREVDQFLLEQPQYIGRLRESHPEYGFAILNGNKPLMSKNPLPEGLQERVRLPSEYFTQAEQAMAEIKSRYPRQLLDDFMDAMVLSVIGRLGVQHGFSIIPQQPVRDSRGIPMEIVYSEPRL